MNLVAVGVSFQTAPIEIREKMALAGDDRRRAIQAVASRYGCEAVVLNTCNRVEFYLSRSPDEPLPGGELLAEFLAECHHLPADQVRPHLVERRNHEGIRHLFRVASGLDSLVVGEAQIAGQVKEAFEESLQLGTTGGMLNALFQTASKVSKRVRTETGVAEGHVSVSSVAVDYVRQVFDRFDDKTVLIIGAGKMGRLTLKHLREFRPKRVLVTNRTAEKAAEVARDCGGEAIAWDALDEALGRADIVLSTTGAPEPIVTAERFAGVRRRRGGRTTVILDIAVPRDFDPSIHDGETTFLFNIDDLKSVREQTIAKRRSHIERSEEIIEEERRKFVDDWDRRKSGRLIARLTQEFEAKRKEVMDPLLSRLNGKLTDKERQDIEAAFRLFQNKLLHGPITALGEAAKEGSGPGLWEAIRKLFRLE